MIVNYTENGWEIILQRTHGLLAGELCQHWKVSHRPSRWLETLIATTEHDDVFNEFERGPLLTTKLTPLDFKMTCFDEKASEDMISMALSKSRFIALLLASHINFTHGEEPKAAKFLRELKTNSEKWRQQVATNGQEVANAYELLEFCDAFSLLICQDQIPPGERKLEISTGPDGRRFHFFQRKQTLVVEPWPFEEHCFEVSYERRILEAVSFQTDEDLQSALESARIEVRKVVLSRSI